MVFYNRIFMASGKETERQMDHAIMLLFQKCLLYCTETVSCKIRLNLQVKRHVLCLQASHR